MNHNLPTHELKEYGIINTDNTFSKKLSEDDVEKFLKGESLVADNGKDRVVFQLKDNNTRLEVNVYQRDRELTDILNNAKKEISYSSVEKKTDKNEILGFEKKAFVYDEKLKQIVEFDLIKNSKELTQIIAERKNADETNRYKEELLKLKDFLLDKIDKYPEIAKDITKDLNIVSKEINTVDDLSPNKNQSQKQEKTDIQLGVNDPDRYQDANEQREENFEEKQEQERKRGFRR